MSSADLSTIAGLQKFDGSFGLDERLAAAVRINLQTLKQACTANDWKDDAWATTVVLAFFATQLEDLQADWELLADKSKLWLDSKYETVVEGMFEKALGLFP